MASVLNPSDSVIKKLWCMLCSNSKCPQIRTLYLKYFGPKFCFLFSYFLTLVLLKPDIPCFANSVDPDQLASEEAN